MTLGMGNGLSGREVYFLSHLLRFTFENQTDLKGEHIC